MTVSDMLPWLNLLLLPVMHYLRSIEQRLTRLEALREAEERMRTNPPSLTKGVAL